MKQGPCNDDGPMRRGQPSVERRGKVSKQNRYEPVPCWDAIVDGGFILLYIYVQLCIYVCIYIDIYIYINMYVYICIYIYTFNGDWTIESSKEV